jgi:hypothetical protein
MGVYQSGDGFTVGTSPTTPQPVFFCISQGANSLCDIQPDVLAGDYITITYDVGQQKNIYLPRITSKPTLLWIGSDGSTFYDSALTQLAQSVPTEGFATITNITAPTSAHIGDPISINVTIRNDGGVTDNFFVWITDLDTLSKMVDTVTLAPGQTYTTGLDTTMPNRDLRLKIDAGYVE